VETLYWVGQIFKHGAAWYTQQQRPRFFSICGRVRQPGVYRAPSTATVAELIEAADGLTDGHTFTAFLPGGASGGIFPARFSNRVMDFGVFEKLGGFVGSGALTVLSDLDDVWDVAQTLSNFFAAESCGQCTPCRIGCEKLAVLVQEPEANESLIRELASCMREASICGLGQAAANPILTLLDHLEDEA
jgi:formate dehydrogenase